MFGRKRKRVLQQVPEQYLDFVKKSGMSHVGVGHCEKCGHFRWNVSSFDGPPSLPCPRCEAEGGRGTIRFEYAKV